MSQDPDVASAVAAIRSLLEFLKRDQSKSTHYGSSSKELD